jgi:hypothetical protein
MGMGTGESGPLGGKGCVDWGLVVGVSGEGKGPGC